MPSDAMLTVQHDTIFVLFPQAHRGLTQTPAYDRNMPHSPTTVAVSDAITHYRQLRELTRDELSYLLSVFDHPLSPGTIAQMESREIPITVDDLMAIAFALDTTPAVLLSHVPIDMPTSDGPLASGLPSDVEPSELRAWIEGRTSLDPAARITWYQNRVNHCGILSAHHEEQLEGAYEELRELGELATREADAPPVQTLQDRIRVGEYQLNQSEVTLAMAEQHLEQLREDAS